MKDAWIKQLKKSHQRLLEALDLILDNEEISEGWFKKEILAHISGWYTEGVEGTPQILKGEKPSSFRMTINGYNKRSVEQRKKMNLDEARNEMIELHKKFVQVIEKLNEDEIKGFYGTLLSKKQINVLWMIKMSISHDNAHAKALEKRFRY